MKEEIERLKSIIMDFCECYNVIIAVDMDYMKTADNTKIITNCEIDIKN